MRRGWELSQKNPTHQEDILRQTDNLQKLWQQLQDEVADRKSRLQAAALIKQVSRALLWCVVWRGRMWFSSAPCPCMQGNSGRKPSGVSLQKDLQQQSLNPPASEPGRRSEQLGAALS